MKRILLAAAFVIGLSAFATVQAQDTSGHMHAKKGTMKKSDSKMKKNSHRNSDSTGTYGTMNNRRRDSM